LFWQLVVEDGLKNLPALEDVFLKRFSQEIKTKRTIELQSKPKAKGISQNMKNTHMLSHMK